MLFRLSQTEMFIFTFIHSRVLVFIEYNKLADYDFSKANYFGKDVDCDTGLDHCSKMEQKLPPEIISLQIAPNTCP